MHVGVQRTVLWKAPIVLLNLCLALRQCCALAHRSQEFADLEGGLSASGCLLGNYACFGRCGARQDAAAQWASEQDMSKEVDVCDTAGCLARPRMCAREMELYAGSKNLATARGFSLAPSVLRIRHPSVSGTTNDIWARLSLLGAT